MSLVLLFPVPKITLFARFSPYFVLPVTVILGVSGATKAAELSIQLLAALRSVTRPWNADRLNISKAPAIKGMFYVSKIGLF